ncbi:MAG TPA: hypothetical protein VF698_18265 [Thermoanaerobaculia bacterium]|jgi:enoyl-CoA hydratase/carnithine racemase
MRILGPAELAAAGPRDVERIAGGDELTLAVAIHDLRGLAAAAALFAGFFAIGETAMLHLDTGEAWGGAVWRIGPAAMSLHLQSRASFTAREAMRAGLADALVPSESDPVEWAAGWLGGRSTAALQSAATLIRRRGGDAAERAEFARLFAAGEPQEGLAAFLEKRRPDWRT